MKKEAAETAHWLWSIYILRPIHEHVRAVTRHKCTRCDWED